MCLWSLLLAFDSMAVVLISLTVELLRAHLYSASSCLRAELLLHVHVPRRVLHRCARRPALYSLLDHGARSLPQLCRFSCTLDGARISSHAPWTTAPARPCFSLSSMAASCRGPCCSSPISLCSMGACPSVRSLLHAPLLAVVGSLLAPRFSPISLPCACPAVRSLCSAMSPAARASAPSRCPCSKSVNPRRPGSSLPTSGRRFAPARGLLHAGMARLRWPDVDLLIAMDSASTPHYSSPLFFVANPRRVRDVPIDPDDLS
ncbi:hypothetical protein ZEAMMB73_Zm00001d041339, partial [Zea mays]